MGGISWSSNMFMRSATPEVVLFGEAFNDVYRCLSLMKEKRVIASGSALFRAFRPSFTWVPLSFEFFVCRSSLGECGSSEWQEFFLSEGYALMNITRGTSNVDEQVSCQLYLLCSSSHACRCMSIVVRKTRLM